LHPRYIIAPVTKNAYAFGSGVKERTASFTFPYRFSMNTQEKEPELGEGVTSAEFWVYDGKLGRRWNVDPVIKHYESYYACLGNNPIWFLDIFGNDSTISVTCLTSSDIFTFNSVEVGLPFFVNKTDKDGSFSVPSKGDNGAYYAVEASRGFHPQRNATYDAPNWTEKRELSYYARQVTSTTVESIVTYEEVPVLDGNGLTTGKTTFNYSYPTVIKRTTYTEYVVTVTSKIYDSNGGLLLGSDGTKSTTSYFKVNETFNQTIDKDAEIPSSFVPIIKSAIAIRATTDKTNHLNSLGGSEDFIQVLDNTSNGFGMAAKAGEVFALAKHPKVKLAGEILTLVSEGGQELTDELKSVISEANSTKAGNKKATYTVSNMPDKYGKVQSSFKRND
jgi:hypothetical protein